VVGLIALLFVLGAVQHVVINVMAPRVMGTAMDMHPLLVMLGLLLGAKLAGIWGAIFGVPVFGVILDTTDLIYRRVMERRYGFHPPSRAEMAAEDEPSSSHQHGPSVSDPPAVSATPADPRSGPEVPSPVAAPSLASANPPQQDPEREMTTIS
jgi:predicted lipid-binding transport protein (Tim44 family)